MLEVLWICWCVKSTAKVCVLFINLHSFKNHFMAFLCYFCFKPQLYIMYIHLMSTNLYFHHLTHSLTHTFLCLKSPILFSLKIKLMFLFWRCEGCLIEKFTPRWVIRKKNKNKQKLLRRGMMIQTMFLPHNLINYMHQLIEEISTSKRIKKTTNIL